MQSPEWLKSKEATVIYICDEYQKICSIIDQKIIPGQILIRILDKRNAGVIFELKTEADLKTYLEFGRADLIRNYPEVLVTLSVGSRSLISWGMLQYPSCCGSMVAHNFGFQDTYCYSHGTIFAQFVLDLIVAFTGTGGFTNLNYILAKNGNITNQMFSEALVKGRHYDTEFKFKNRRTKNTCVKYDLIICSDYT